MTTKNNNKKNKINEVTDNLTEDIKKEDIVEELNPTPIKECPIITISINNLNVRENPSKTANILGLAMPGSYDLLDMVESDGEKWGHISYLDGWVNLAYTSYSQE